MIPFSFHQHSKCSSLPSSQNLRRCKERWILPLFTIGWLILYGGFIFSSERSSGFAQDTDPRKNLGKREMTAVRLQGKIKIDGKLNEEGWKHAQESRGFVERSPKPGDKPPVLSTVRVLYDQEALYVGVAMHYDAKSPPVAWELRRDSGWIWGDDAITLKIDPRRDRRTSLGFAMNVAGANLDLIALDNGKSFLTEYDMLWEGATSNDPENSIWYAEYRIPYVALAFEAGDKTPEPGINLSRDHPARQATDDWTLLPPEFGPSAAIHYGVLKGLKDVQGGQPLVMMPYWGINALDQGASQLGTLELNNEITTRIGGDFRFNVSEGLWLEASLLTDFAQVDLDDALLNLDRFPLFFPERRPFFLNGTDVFTFGAFGTAQPYFSRRIGLTRKGEEMPLYGGLKVYNRSGALRYGVLNTLSESADGTFLSNATVGRARYEVGDGYIGMILTHAHAFESLDSDSMVNTPLMGDPMMGDPMMGDPMMMGDPVMMMTASSLAKRSLPQWETGMGLDASQRFLNKRLELSGSYSGLVQEESKWIDGSLNGGLEWSGKDYQGQLQVLRVGQDYAPQLGFVRRSNYTSLQGELSRYYWKPTGWNRFNFGGEFEVSTDAFFENLLDRSAGANAELRSIDGWRFGINAGYSQVVVNQDDFELDEVAIAEGTYSGATGGAFVSTPFAGARWRGSLRFLYNDAFFGGTSYTGSLDANASISAHFRMSLRLVNSYYTLPNGTQVVEKNEQAWNGSMIFMPSTRLQFDVVGQMNSQTDKVLGLSRIRWRWAPGSDLFLVYRMEVNQEDQSQMNVLNMMNPLASQWTINEQRLMFKIVWRSDLLLQ